MPFPLAGLGVLGWLGVAAGTAVAGAAAYAAKEVYDEKMRDEARKDAELRASRERERQLIEKIKELTGKREEISNIYGEDIPNDKAKEIGDEISVILGELEGNRIGLEKQGLKASSEAQAAEEELAELFEDGAIKK